MTWEACSRTAGQPSTYHPFLICRRQWEQLLSIGWVGDKTEHRQTLGSACTEEVVLGGSCCLYNPLKAAEMEERMGFWTGVWRMDKMGTFSEAQSVSSRWWSLISLSVQFSSVQFSRSVVSDSLWPHESQHARPLCPSPSPRVHSDSRPSSQWCHPAISSWVVPFSSCP